MLRRKKQYNETYSEYLYEINAMLINCNITGVGAVSCLIGGIVDVIVKTGAKAGKHQTLEQLYEYLCTMDDDEPYLSKSGEIAR